MLILPFSVQKHTLKFDIKSVLLFISVFTKGKTWNWAIEHSIQKIYLQYCPNISFRILLIHIKNPESQELLLEEMKLAILWFFVTNT